MYWKKKSQRFHVFKNTTSMNRVSPCPLMNYLFVIFMSLVAMQSDGEFTLIKNEGTRQCNPAFAGEKNEDTDIRSQILLGSIDSPSSHSNEYPRNLFTQGI